MKNICIFFSIILNICLSNSDTAKKLQSYNYSGGWPINLDKKQLTENFDSANLNCPNGLGCECDENDDCLNNNCNKNQLRRKGNYCSLKEGDLFPQIKLYDQFEEEVDIYDFANKDDKYILIEMGTVWCGPCHSLASWLTWGENEIKNKVNSWSDKDTLDFINDLENISNPDISVTARTIDLYEQQLFPDCNKKMFHEKLKNKAEETESGLRYHVTKSGNGIKVDENKVILTHYAVYFEDGQLLDTSVLEIAEKFNMVNIQRKNANGYTPIEAKVGPKDMMISGFKEGLKLLNVGDKAILYIPYYLAYGEMENRGIPAKSNLIFEVEIVDQL